MNDIIFPRPPLRKPLVWLHAEIKSPPMAEEGRKEAGKLLRKLQQGEHLSLPESRPMPVIGGRCHELRVLDSSGNWRIIYRIDASSILVVHVFRKATERTPLQVIRLSRRRLQRYDAE